MALTFLDCNVMLGSRSAPRPESALTDEQILEEMARTGIDRALFVHAWAKELDPRTGNGKAAELAAEHENLEPAFVLLPEHTAEFPTGDALIDYLRDGGARAAWLYPKLHGFGLGETWSGGLLGTLAEAGVPVLMTLDQTAWGEIDQALTEHPSLNLIVCRTGYRITRWAYPLFAKHEGLRIETSLFEQHLGIETITEKFGADRLVFGTGLPEYDAGGAMTPVLYAAVADGDREQIAGGTLESLIEGAAGDPPPAESTTRSVSLIEARPSRASAATQGDAGDLWPFVRAGETLTGELLIDCHAHMGPWHDFHIPRPWAEGMLFAMDACGIDRAACAPHAGIGPAEELGNEQIAQAVREHPDRFLGYCSINPRRSEEAIRAQLEQHILRGNLTGIKIHPSIHRYAAADDGYRPMWEFANEHGVPVLIHTWDGSKECKPSLFADLGKQYPNVDLLLGHCGGTCAGMDETIETAQKWERLYLDLTGSLLPRGMLERMVGEVGADRILFGTDIPFVDARPQIGYVACARISDDAKRAIFGLNAKRVLQVAQVARPVDAAGGGEFPPAPGTPTAWVSCATELVAQVA